MAPLEAFRHVLETNLWGDPESISGSGRASSTQPSAHYLRRSGASGSAAVDPRLLWRRSLWQEYLPASPYTGATCYPTVSATSAPPRPIALRSLYLTRRRSRGGSPVVPDCLFLSARRCGARAGQLRRPGAPTSHPHLSGEHTTGHHAGIGSPTWNGRRSLSPPPSALLTEGCTEAGNASVQESRTRTIQYLPKARASR